MIRKITLAALVTAIATLVGMYAPKAGAATASSQASAAPTAAFLATASNCPEPFNQPWYTCDIRPAEMTTVNKSSSSSHVHIVVQKTTKASATQYEHATGVRVVIYGKSTKALTGCVDPIAKGWIQDNGPFQNTGGITVYRFWTNWQAGWKICGAHKVQINGYWYWQGTKQNCVNKNIRIPIGPVAPHQLVQEIEFRSTSSFKSTYDRWVNHQSSSTSSHVTYPTCAYLGLGWGVAYVGGNWICFKPNLVPVAPSPTPQPTPPSAPTPYCYMPNGQPFYGTSAPSGFTLQGNQCVVITVICGNIGNNNGGNCNNNPPATPPSIPKPTASDLTLIQEVYTGETRANVCGNTSVGTSSGTVKFTAQKGWFTDITPSATVGQGAGFACATYHAPTEAGTDVITMTVTDSSGQTASVSENVTVLAQPSNRP